MESGDREEYGARALTAPVQSVSQCAVGIAAGGITRDASMTSRWTLDGQLLSIACPSVTSLAHLPMRDLSSPTCLVLTKPLLIISATRAKLWWNCD